MAIMRAYATKGLCETDQEQGQAWGSGRFGNLQKAKKKNKNNTVPSGDSGLFRCLK